MIVALLLAAAVDTTPPSQAPASARDTWVGPDKVKHFFVSAFVQSGAYAASRGVKLSHSNAVIVASVSTAAIGVGREVHDKRRGRPFSLKDLVWDAAGATAAALLLNKTR